MRRFLTITYSWARRCVIAFVGGTVVLLGVIMIVTPGPALVVIPAGLAILGLEFACARRWLQQLRTTGTKMVGRTRLWLKPTAARTEEKNSKQASGWREPNAQRSIAASQSALKAHSKTVYY